MFMLIVPKGERKEENIYLILILFVFNISSNALATDERKFK